MIGDFTQISRTPGLQMANFSYFDQYLVNFVFIFLYLQEIRFLKNIGNYEVKKIWNIGQNGYKCPTGGLYLQNQKLSVCIHKTLLLSGITLTVSFKIKPVIQIYANVSYTLPPIISVHKFRKIKIIILFEIEAPYWAG